LDPHIFEDSFAAATVGLAQRLKGQGNSLAFNGYRRKDGFSKNRCYASDDIARSWRREAFCIGKNFLAHEIASVRFWILIVYAILWVGDWPGG